MKLETLSEHQSFGGLQGFYRHQSALIGLPMQFSVYQPPQARQRQVPVVFYLAGLTCTEETFTIKAGAQRVAAQLGVMLVTCDTSPRRTGIPGEADDWEFGTGAGFYLNASQAPWSQYFRTYDYVLEELRETVLTQFPGIARRLGIFGHSMGGHGALVLALRNPEVYRSVSAFAPICSPTRCRSEEHTSELQSRVDLVCRLLLEKKKIRNAEWGSSIGAWQHGERSAACRLP